MPNAPHPPRVGLLALALEFYETLAPDLRPGRERWLADAVLPALAPIADVRFHRAVFRREDVEAAVAELQGEGVELLLVMCLTYAPSLIALPALRRTSLPVVLWNTQELYAIDESFGPADTGANHGVHGTQDLANVLLRSGVRFEYVTCHLNDPDALARLSNVLVAAAAAGRLRGARLGRMGYPFPGMGDLAVDEAHLAGTLGCHVVPLGVDEFNRRAASADPEEVARLANAYRQSYELADDLTEADLDSTARAECALRWLVNEHRLDGLTYQFLALGENDQTVPLPFVGASRLMADGVGFGGEGDVIAAAGTWLLGQLAPPATFSEIFSIDFAGNGVLVAHMGESNPAMARRDRRIRLVARPKPIVPTRGRQLALVAAPEPGPATLCCLTLGPGGRWRLIAGRVEIADFGPLGSLAVPHFKLRVPGDVRDWLTAYATAGGAHHNAVCFGDATARIRAFAGHVDADYVELQ